MTVMGRFLGCCGAFLDCEAERPPPSDGKRTFLIEAKLHVERFWSSKRRRSSVGSPQERDDRM